MTDYPDARTALAAKTRHVPDFPGPGIVFQDLTPVLADGTAFRTIVTEMADVCREFDIDVVAGLDARGFLLGSAVALQLGVGVLALRKAGKLPSPVFHQDYALEYGTAALEIPSEGLDVHGRRVLLVDDVLATGGTLVAARALLDKAGAITVGVAVALEVPELQGAKRLGDLPLYVVSRGQ